MRSLKVFAVIGLVVVFAGVPMVQAHVVIQDALKCFVVQEGGRALRVAFTLKDNSEEPKDTTADWVVRVNWGNQLPPNFVVVAGGQRQQLPFTFNEPIPVPKNIDKATVRILAQGNQSGKQDMVQIGGDAALEQCPGTPTLTQWGLIVLGLLLAGSLAFMIRRRLAPRPAGA